MIPGEVRRGFFQELVLHPQFPRFAFQLAKPFPFATGQRRLLAGMIPPMPRDPTTQSSFTDLEFASDFHDRTRIVDDEFHGLQPELG
jgi:hypothetical protein